MPQRLSQRPPDRPDRKEHSRAREQETAARADRDNRDVLVRTELRVSARLRVTARETAVVPLLQEAMLLRVSVRLLRAREMHARDREQVLLQDVRHREAEHSTAQLRTRTAEMQEAATEARISAMTERTSTLTTFQLQARQRPEREHSLSRSRRLKDLRMR